MRTRLLPTSAVLLVVLAGGSGVEPAIAQHVANKKPPVSAVPPAAAPAPSAATPSPPPEARPYDPQLIRLAEILGALSYLGTICKERNADMWRSRMQALLDAEGTSQARKDRFAGAFNRGVNGYGLSYRTCTPNARFVIERFLSEGERIAKDLENHYGAG